jgi:hypothetical protein
MVEAASVEPSEVCFSKLVMKRGFGSKRFNSLGLVVAISCPRVRWSLPESIQVLATNLFRLT